MFKKPIKILSILKPKFWGQSRQIVKTDSYMGNINYYLPGQSGALQLHPVKDETLHLFKGEAILWFGNRETKELWPVNFYEGETHRIPPGTVHKFQAITDCVVFEISTPIEDDRINLEDEFKNSIG